MVNDASKRCSFLVLNFAIRITSMWHTADVTINIVFVLLLLSSSNMAAMT